METLRLDLERREEEDRRFAMEILARNRKEEEESKKRKREEPGEGKKWSLNDSCLRFKMSQMRWS